MYIHQASIGWPYAFACASLDDAFPHLAAGCFDTWDMGPEMNYRNICEMEQRNQDTVPLQESAELFLASNWNSEDCICYGPFVFKSRNLISLA